MSQPLKLVRFLAKALLNSCVYAHAFPQHLDSNQSAFPPPQKHLQDASRRCRHLHRKSKGNSNRAMIIRSLIMFLIMLKSGNSVPNCLSGSVSVHLSFMPPRNSQASRFIRSSTPPMSLFLKSGKHLPVQRRPRPAPEALQPHQRAS